MKNGDDDKSKNIRTRSHEVAVERRVGGMRLLSSRCNLHAKFRGGNSVIYFKPGSRHKYIKRITGEDRVMQTMGLDTIISDLEIGKELWVQMDPRGEKQVRMFPGYATNLMIL